jgi:hypothetical protein
MFVVLKIILHIEFILGTVNFVSRTQFDRAARVPLTRFN